LFVRVDDLVTSIMARPGPLRLVAIDGPGGAGKSTFAQALSEAAGGAPVIHTDDFASWDNPIDWWPRLLEQVIEPLVRGEAAHYQRYDWPSSTLAEWHTVEPAPIIIIEGVSAGRPEWSAHLSYIVWVETPWEERLRRGIERDGIEALDDWRAWMASEDTYYERAPTRERADVVIDGTEPLGELS
jgi:uridine kinase